MRFIKTAGNEDKVADRENIHHTCQVQLPSNMKWKLILHQHTHNLGDRKGSVYKNTIFTFMWIPIALLELVPQTSHFAQFSLKPNTVSL